jgi:hypothetical protein
MFPPEHWDALREGSSMNFMHQPRCEITPNSPMDEEQIAIAEEFLDELVSLGTFIPVAPGEMVANGPLFCLPKPGQPGQWRILSDMKRGGQNAAIGPDPTVFPKSEHILDQMYTNGWSAVVDASKFFYQFKTHPKDRKYLGCIHPRHPEQHYVYGGLAMGAGNSPALAGRYGAALLELLRLKSQYFQGQVQQNTWWAHYAFDKPLDPELGHGLVTIGKDGSPVALAWGHCDDFLLHSPTRVKTLRALHDFLDLAVDVGLLCHPGKLTPPCHVVKYTGYLFDTKSVPTLKIPEYKVDRGLALVAYALRHKNHISRLALAVVLGVLESLVEATPSHIGHTYLRRLQYILHRTDWAGNDLPYFSFAILDADCQDELDLWKWLLQLNPGRHARGTAAGTLIPSFGDGSGTGTGGTVCYPNGTDLEMWMGVWTPQVFHFTSNWKEARTLLATLERARARVEEMLSTYEFRGSTFFYFTDNSTTYYTVSSGSSKSPGIHLLVKRIKQLEIELGIHLEVVHVPGTTLIVQGTDGLSRGVWLSALQKRPDQSSILSAIFAPIPFSPDVGAWALNQVGLPPSTLWSHRAWNRPLDPEFVRHMLTIWTPPPEIAYQLLYQLLQCYVQSPLDTAAIIIIPRILKHRWSRLSRQICEIGTYQRAEIPFVCHSPLTIPAVVLYLPYHVRIATGDRLDSTVKTAERFTHRQLAALVRGLLEPPE